jgi:hypothetical protein
MPDVLTNWANERLRASGRRREPIGRKELALALRSRGGRNGSRTQRTIGGRVSGAWLILRDGLGEAWDGLLAGGA